MVALVKDVDMNFPCFRLFHLLDYDVCPIMFSQFCLISDFVIVNDMLRRVRH